PVNPTTLKLRDDGVTPAGCAQADDAPAEGEPVAAALRPHEGPALGFGLYQGTRLGNEAGQAYRAALNQMLLPRLLLRLEDQISANMNNPDVLYEVLKVYLILGQLGPMNQDLIRQFMQIDWAIAFAGPSRDGLRGDLDFHLQSLLGQPMDLIALNGPLVEQAQGVLAKLPLAQ